METGALQSLFNQKTTQQSKSAEFRPGQIINGKIIKLFPEQVAEVQIGNQKLIAQLEAPLSANERYWFQVQPGEGKVHLKVISSSGDDSGQPSSLTRILAEYSLQPTKENLDLVRFFIKEHLPVNRELLKQTSEWLKMVDSRTAGQEAIKTILTRGIPVTQAAFEALYTTTKEQSLVLLMEKLAIALDGPRSTEAGANLKKLLNELLPSNKIMSSQAAIHHITATWMKGNGQESEAAFELLKRFGAIQPGSRESTVLLQMKNNLLSLDSTGAAVPEGLKFAKAALALIERGDNITAGKIISSFTNATTFSLDETVEPLKQLFNRPNGKEMNLQAGLQAFKKLMSVASDIDSVPLLLSGKEVLRQAGMELLNQQQRQQSGDLPVLQSKLLSEAAAKAEQSAIIPETSTAILSDTKIKGFLTALGLSYEHQVGEVLKDPENGKVQMSDTLKSLLLRLLNENPSQSVRDAAEPLLNKLTGFQLLSQEAGPIQQLVVQIPIMMGGKSNELMMQWSGKKTEDGKIDADFCRVLFYLKLEHLNDTIVDMQVQNRVMSIHVFNDQPQLKKMAEQLTPMLKKKLLEMDYQLSSVHFHLPGESQPGRNQQRMTELYGQKEYNGVDLKI